LLSGATGCGVPAVNPDRYRAIVEAHNFHACPEFPGFYTNAVRARRNDECIVSLFGLFGWHGRIEAWSPPAAHVTVKRKLAHHEQSSCNVNDAFVHFAIFVIENAKPDDLRKHVGACLGVVSQACTQVDEKSAIDSAYDFAIDFDFCPGHSLNDCTH